MEGRYILGYTIIIFFLIPIWLYIVVNVITSAYYEAKFTKLLNHLKERRKLLIK